ncbi:hypothetical protein Daus18300_010720 [Diaporthe australafricana]|uniref:Heterokaryon incompatibility domain-containing protein n=1 Tax=Diaporthe australafricana TaxID=127596 RepID=A0ABR3W9E2_9PEZI
MATGRYQYFPLTEPRHIRLLKLNPGATSQDTEVSVDLITVSLDAAPPFEALSYAWGNPLPQAEIRCSGLTAHIGPSLYGALRQLRRPAPGPARLTWADALCINQKDVPERNAQVRLMGEIYAAAVNTVIWLGEEDEDVARAMVWLRRFRDVWETLDIPVDFGNHFQDMLFRFGANDGLERERTLQTAFGERSSRLKAYRDIWALLRRPWFSRKWVIQEVAKSLDHGLVLVAGSKMVAWSTVHAWFAFLPWNPAALQMFNSCWQRKLDVSSPGSSDVWSEYKRVTALALMGKGDEPLMYLLVNTLAFRCTDPRDHIIALLGMSTDSSLHKDLVDYGVPTEELYRRLARDCLRDSRDLAILWSFVSVDPVDQRTINSWIPNIELLPTMRSEATSAMEMTHFQIMCGDASTSTELDACVIGDRLRIKGRLIDRLERLGMDMSVFPETHFYSDSTSTGGFRELRDRIGHWINDCQAITESTSLEDEHFQTTFLTEELFQNLVPDAVAAAKQDLPAYRRVQKALASAVDETSLKEARTMARAVTSMNRIDSLLSRKPRKEI